MLDRAARRHVYGLGRLPDGAPASELGGLASRQPAGGIPVWQTADGRIVTDAYSAEPAGRTRPLTAAAYVVAPIRWSGHGRGVRARALLRRILELRRTRQAIPRGAGAAPSGYLFREPEAGTRPLLSALHPVTGDQLVTTDPDEPRALGYVETTPLGHVRTTAPVTGTLGLSPTDVPWAREFGLGFESQAGLFLGALELPAPGTRAAVETLRISGWAVALGDRVRRVEVFIDGEPLGRARLAMPRNDLMRHPPLAGAPDAVLAGFELVPSIDDLRQVPELATITVLVTSMAGHTLVLESNEVRLTRSVLAVADEGGRSNDHHPPRRERSSGGLLAFTHRLDLGGAQRYFVDQLLRLQRAGFTDCTVVSFRDGPWRERLERAGIEVHVTSAYPESGPGEYEGRLEELRAWCKPGRHSVAFASTLDCFIGVDLAKRLGLPVAWALHESFDPKTWWTVGHGWSPDHAYVFERIEHALRAADATIFAAEATRRLYEPYIDGERSVMLPYGIEFDEVDEFRRSSVAASVRRAHGVRPDARVVLCLAMMGSRKGQALLTQAFAAVAPDHPDAELLLVGATPGPYGDAIADYVASMSLESRVRIVPVTDDAYAWHVVSDVFALASDLESLPLSVIEAMAFEKPVVASRVFGVPELIEDGLTGFLFEPNDLGELASALDRVLSMDAGELGSVARAGAELVRERHDPERYSERLVGVLQSLQDSLQAA